MGFTNQVSSFFSRLCHCMSKDNALMFKWVFSTAPRHDYSLIFKSALILNPFVPMGT